LSTYDAVIIPGGFSYGDYLRAGALARFLAGDEFGQRIRGPKVTWCWESATAFRYCARPVLLPGALIRNRDLHFICDYVHVALENTDTPFTHEMKAGSVLRMPIAHAEGIMLCDDVTFAEVAARGTNHISLLQCGRRDH
jgi:phosphoribosylformylglycinamidine synthase